MIITQPELPISSAGPAINSKNVFPISDTIETHPAGADFESALQQMVQRLNETQNESDRSITRLAAGQEPNIHTTMLAIEQADLSLRLAMQVRSKMLDAYNELMHMQL